jgi:HSP20 family protein
MLRNHLIGFPSTPVGGHHSLAAINAVERMARQMDRLSDAFLGRPGARWPSSGLFPVLNLTEDHDNYYVRSQLPGVKADKLELQLNGRKLTLTGERYHGPADGHVNYHRRERLGGEFARVIELPGEVDANRVDAEMRAGLLTVKIAKAEDAKPKQIAVH